MTSVGPDTTPPTVSSVYAGERQRPAPRPNTAVTAHVQRERERVDGHRRRTFELRNGANVLVPATVTYSAPTRTATLEPNAPLAYSTTYTARVRGGATGVKDTRGQCAGRRLHLVVHDRRSAAAAADRGSGRPDPRRLDRRRIRSAATTRRSCAPRASTPSRRRTSPLVTATTLADYDVVILGEMPLTPTQVTMFTNWVTAGGNLIAMRPDKQLAALLGLTDAATTLARRLPAGQHRGGARRRDRRPDDAVSRHGRPLHAERRDADRHALLERDDRDDATRP